MYIIYTSVHTLLPWLLLSERTDTSVSFTGTAFSVCFLMRNVTRSMSSDTGALATLASASFKGGAWVATTEVSALPVATREGESLRGRGWFEPAFESLQFNLYPTCVRKPMYLHTHTYTRCTYTHTRIHDVPLLQKLVFSSSASE